MKGFWKKKIFANIYRFFKEQTLNTRSFKGPFFCNFKEFFWKVYI